MRVLQSSLSMTAQRFKSVLEDRNRSLQQQHSRKALYGGQQRSLLGKPLTFADPGAVAGTGAASALVLPRPHGTHAPPAARTPTRPPTDSELTTISLSRDVDEEDGAGRGRAGEAAPLLRSTMELLPVSSTYEAMRADAAVQIESSVAELGQIFRRLGTLIATQHEQIERCVRGREVT